jgi:hypothetical protein
VWALDSRPNDLDATWPAALVARIVTSFSEPAAQVVLLAWPTPNEDRPTLVPPGVGGVVEHSPGAAQNPELTGAVCTVEHLGRTVRIEHVPLDPTAIGPASRPFWADLIEDSDPAPAPVSTAPAVAVDTDARHGKSRTSGGADLIVASLCPQHCANRGADLVALFAARLLRVGGILAMFTHCDSWAGELIDPTGDVVTAGQNVDLLYLQHVVAVHAPVRNGAFHLADTRPDHHTDDGPDDEGIDDAQFRTRHRALVRGLPAPHRRIHSDLLVFAQPHDHQAPTNEPSRDGDLR